MRFSGRLFAVKPQKTGFSGFRYRSIPSELEGKENLAHQPLQSLPHFPLD